MKSKAVRQKRVYATKKEQVEVTLKSILQWLVVSALSFIYWLAVLLLISLFMVNVWHVTYEELVRYALILAVATAVVYGVIILRRRIKS